MVSLAWGGDRDSVKESRLPRLSPGAPTNFFSDFHPDGSGAGGRSGADHACAAIVRSKLNLLAKSPHARWPLRNLFEGSLSTLSDGNPNGRTAPAQNRRCIHYSYPASVRKKFI